MSTNPQNNMNDSKEETTVPDGPWWRGATPQQWKVLWAAFLGWALDVMDLMLYSMVIVYVIQEFQFDSSMAGTIASATLIASAFGGIIFGFVADKFGRTKSMLYSILVYSLFSLMCGFSTTFTQLLVFRILVGLGTGGEWSAGAALVTESWPAKHRAKVMAFVQSSFAVGYALAAFIAMIVVPVWGWRGVFFVGVLPALLTLWIRKHTPESEVWQAQKKRYSFKEIVGQLFGAHKRNTIICLLFTGFAMLGYWGLFTWIPTYLATPVSEGGPGLDVVKSGMWIIVMQFGAWLGFLSYGYVADWLGRKKSFALYFVISAICVPLYMLIDDVTLLLIFGPVVAFFGTGFYSGFGPTFAELFPTGIRATAQGFIYNAARALSALAPFIIGQLAVTQGLASALLVTSGFFLLAAVVVMVFLPETRNKELV
ncbi:MFS transporter [Brevibacillus sp. TJ4]|uniref:MFS transporter n=1 Tax=Brevibacillus sp. TJ4 TaxID=3234853 RepID=UPI0037D26677